MSDASSPTGTATAYVPLAAGSSSSSGNDSSSSGHNNDKKGDVKDGVNGSHTNGNGNVNDGRDGKEAPQDIVGHARRKSAGSGRFTWDIALIFNLGDPKKRVENAGNYLSLSTSSHYHHQHSQVD
jgi:hypothetical protein